MATARGTVTITDVHDGDPGISGKSTFFATVFKQSSTAPEAPPDGEGTFNFGTNKLTAPVGWYSSIPTNNYYFVLGSASDRLRRWTINEALEVTSLTDLEISPPFSGFDTVEFPTEAPLETTPTAFAFNKTGDTVYIVGTTADTIRSYSLSVPWSPSSLVVPNTGSFSLSGIEANIGGMKFSEDGYILYVLGTSNDRLRQLNLSVPWDVSTASYNSVQSIVFTQDSAPTDFVIDSEGTTLIVLGATNKRLYQYSLSSPWNLSTVTYTGKSFSLANQDVITTPTFIAASPRAFNIDSSGKKLFVAGTTTDNIYEYKLTTAWDVSTISYTGNSRGSNEGTASFSMLVSNVKEDVYSSSYLFSVIGDTGTDEAVNWSSPVKVVSSANLTVSTYNALVYQRATSLPATPSGGAYSFTKNVLYPPSGWSATVPTGTDPVYVTSSNLSITGATGSVSIVDWSTPVLFAQNGADGEAAWPASGEVVIRRNRETEGDSILVEQAGKWRFLTGLTGSNPDATATHLHLGYSTTDSQTSFLSTLKTGDYLTVTTTAPAYSGRIAYQLGLITKRENYFFNGVAGQSFYEFEVSSVKSFGSLAGIPLDAGAVTVNFDFSRASGQRGAGWWRYDAGSNNLTTVDVTFYWDALHEPNIIPVEGDRFVIATTHTSGTKSFIFSNGDWVAQAAFIDGNLLVAGTVTANALAADSVTANSLAADSVTADAIAATNVITTSAQITDGIITNAKIGNTIQSTNYVAGTSGWRILKSGSAEFNGVLVSRQLEVASGDYYLGTITDNNSNTLDLLKTFFIETTVDSSAWTGPKETFMALVGKKVGANYGTISALNSNITNNFLNIQWGFEASVVPITRWSGPQKLWIKVQVYTRLVNYIGDYTLTWRLLKVT